MKCSCACSHELAWRAIRVEFAPGVRSPYIDRHRFTGEPIRNVLVDAKRCADCGAWLPLGPSNDEPEAVKVEIRAAELAARVDEQRVRDRWQLMSDVGFDGAEIAGWIENKYDSEKLPEQFGEHAGYLARCIVTHGDDQ